MHMCMHGEQEGRMSSFGCDAHSLMGFLLQSCQSALPAVWRSRMSQEDLFVFNLLGSRKNERMIVKVFCFF